MRVAGMGFRKGVSHTALLEALMQAGGVGGLTALATATDKAAALQSFAATLALPVLAIDAARLATQPVLTHSPRVKTLYGTGSLAEAAALAATGPGARLIGPRVQSADGMATAAIAIRITP
jgi:cobalt-precorrin 5A hydrolase